MGSARALAAAVEGAAFKIGGLLFGSGLGHVVFLLIGAGSWEGPTSLRKAATFGLSFGLTLINVTYVASFRDRTALPPGLRLAIKAGLVALAAAQISSGLMIATGVRLVIGGDPQAAYATGGWLKPVHGVLMHGILVLPLLAWAAAAAHWTEPEQVRTVRTGVVVYALVVVAAMLVSLSEVGIGPF